MHGRPKLPVALYVRIYILNQILEEGGYQLERASLASEKLFLNLLVLPDFKPIGGDGDGVMERKDDARQAPLLARFQAASKLLIAYALERGGKRLNVDFDVGILKRKWAAFKEPYNKCEPERQVQLLGGLCRIQVQFQFQLPRYDVTTGHHQVLHSPHASEFACKASLWPFHQLCIHDGSEQLHTGA
jgi:hypothetical protein